MRAFSEKSILEQFYRVVTYMVTKKTRLVKAPASTVGVFFDVLRAFIGLVCTRLERGCLPVCVWGAIPYTDATDKRAVAKPSYDA